MNKYEQFNIIKDYANFIRKIEVKLYIVELNQDKIIKSKIYFSNYTVKGENDQSVVIIIYNKCIFFANDGV